MRRNFLLLAKILILSILTSSALGFTSKVSTYQEDTCDATSAAWVDNVTPTNFDLFWEPVPTAVGYQIEILVNGVSVFSTMTPNTSHFVVLPSPLQVGDSIEAQISTECDNGATSLPFSRVLDYIGTVDIVMGIYSIDCDCPYVKGNRNIYDCESGNIVNICGIEKLCDGNNSPARTSVYCSPNPFYSDAQIHIEILKESEISLSIIDFSGKEVLSLLQNENYGAGQISIPFDGSSLETGVYYYILQVGDKREIKRLLKL